jgi:MFS family permease
VASCFVLDRRSWRRDLAAAGPLLVASETHDPLLVALAAVLQRLPWLLFGLLAGVVADRVNRRRIIMVAHLCRAVIAALISALLFAVNQLAGPPIGAALFALGRAPPFMAETTCMLIAAGLASRLALASHGARERPAVRRDIAERFGVTGPFWFAFIGSALFLALIWHQLPNIAHADDPEGDDLRPTTPQSPGPNG